MCGCLIVAPPAQEADQSSVSPWLRGGKEEEEDSSKEGRQRPRHENILSDPFPNGTGY